MRRITRIETLFDAGLLFVFIYAPALTFVPFALSKLVLAFLIGFTLLHQNVLKRILWDFSVRKFLRTFLWVILFILCYFLILTIGTKNNNFVFVQQSVWLILEGLIGSVLMFNYLTSKYDLKEIFRILLGVITFQSIVVILTFFSVGLRDLINAVLVVSDERHISSYRMRGLSNGGGAGLSYVQALGSLVAGVLMIFDKPSRLKYLFCAVVILISQMFIARTGLIFSFLLLFSTLVQEAYNRKSFLRLLWQFVFGGILIAVVFRLAMSLMSDQTRIIFDELVLNRAFEFYYNYEDSGTLETRSTTALENMYFLPKHDLGLLFGEGLWDVAGQNASTLVYGRKVNSDVGFVRMIFAFGIILTTIYYGVYILFLREIYKSSHGRDILILLLTLFLIFVLGETKEPFLIRMSGTSKILVLFYLFMMYYNRKNSNLITGYAK